MKRSTAMILTIVSILLCGCPGLAVCVGAVETPALVASLVAQGKLPADNLMASMWVTRLVLGLIALVLIAIPVIIGLVFLRKPKAAKMQPVVASMPMSTPPARPPMQQPPAMVSRPAPVYVPPAPAPEPEPLPPVYMAPAPAPEPEPLPPAPEPEPPFADIPPAPVAPEMPPEDQPEEPAVQVFATVETPAPSMLEGATRLASNWCLVFVSGPNPVSTVVLGKKVSFGRSAENDVAVLDPLVSRQHAVVELSGGGYLVTDLGSANGTFINDDPVTTPTRLRVGDQVKFGGTVFRFQPSY